MKSSTSTYALSDLTRRWSRENLAEQFIIGRDVRHIPDSWTVNRIAGWCLGRHPSLPLVTIVGDEQVPIGFFLGYVIDGGGEFLNSGTITLPLHSGESQTAALENWIYSHGGRFVAALLTEPHARIYLDPCGSLSAVYCPPLEIFASTPTLVPREGDTEDLAELARIMNVPFQNGMYPFSLTSRKNVRRLLPNFYLDLRRWESVRHWPPTDFAMSGTTSSLLDKIADRARLQVGALVKRGPVLFRLTAGQDSRTLLACAREWADRMTIFTAEHEYPDETAWLDCSTARRIARDLQLRYLTVPFRRPLPEDLEEWVYRTGATVGEYRGWRASSTYKQLPVGHADILTPISDLMRGLYWRAEDNERSTIEPGRLLERCGTGNHPLGHRAVTEWLESLPTKNPFLTLSLFSIEQRLGCWGGVIPYAYNDGGRFQLFPFCHREIITAMMSLPTERRTEGSLQKELIERQWPELAAYPFSQPRGFQWVGLAVYRAPTYPAAIALRVKRTILHPLDAIHRILGRIRQLVS